MEQKAARVAEGQHGLVTRQQLLAAGVSPAGIDRRVEKGSFHSEYPGVYRVGHRAPTVESSYLAAVLACGEGALLCGRAAAHLWGLTRGKMPPPEVTTRRERRIEGIQTRRSDRGAAATYRAIPITTVPRTLVDLAAVLTPEALGSACHEAGVKYGIAPAHVEAVLAPNAPGAGTLRRVLRGEIHVTLSKLERAFLELLRRHGLPLPETNRPAGGRRVDCRWSDQRLTVELDSYRFHHSRHAWEQDRRREREARARGDEFRRFTYGDVLEHPRLMLRELRGLLLRT